MEAEEADAEAKPKRASFLSKVSKSAAITILTRSANGIMSVSLYFADLVSDVQVRPPPLPPLSPLLHPFSTLI